MNTSQPSAPQGSGSATITPTFALEDTLPRVPLPTLEASCERFLEWCSPLLTPGELKATEAEVAAFAAPGGPGRTLHAALEEYNSSEGVHSWLDTFWPYRYLGRRDRIALNANFFFLFRDSDEQQVERAAGLVAGALNFKKQVDEETIPPTVQRGRPQSMQQLKYLFSSTRIPGTEQDTARTPYSEERPGPSRERHIVVFHRGNLFRMDVIGEDGAPYALEDLQAGLRDVMKAGADRAPDDAPVGHLTTMARAEWARARASLLDVDPGNAKALRTVEDALFCVCLEDFAPAGIQEACDELLYGDRGNRWFDKSLSFVVFEDGRAGINVEHCELDGTTILTFVDALLPVPAPFHSEQSGARTQGTPATEPLRFRLDDALRGQVRSAAEAFEQYGRDTATRTVTFDDFGSNQAKALGVSPDAFVQAAYQLAHRRAKGHLGATYESIATRQYKHGRTEAMRVVTPQMQTFVEAMEDPQADAASRREAFQAAAAEHVERAKQCQAIEAPEQHLWELELIQRRRGEELGVHEQPSLFRSAGWLTMRDDYLSTSSAPSTNIQFFGFGSTSSRCIGVAYVLLPERFNLYLSTPRTVAEQMHTFAEKLREAVDELRELLAQ